jgi:hypothetical protein
MKNNGIQNYKKQQNLASFIATKDMQFESKAFKTGIQVYPSSQSSFNSNCQALTGRLASTSRWLVVAVAGHPGSSAAPS